MRGRAASGLARSAVRRMRGAARAEGAGETGLGQLIEVHGASSAGDALVALGLAGSLFFSVPVGEARGRVALYLLITMAPFALLAPVVGPLLDRVRRGRRLAIAATLVARGVLALSLAGALSGSAPLELYPTAFGLLLCAKAYGVARSAVVPRLLPRGGSLVRVNSRVTLAGLLMAAAVVPLGIAVGAAVGSAWTLRLAAACFFVGAALTFGLPMHVDTTEELPAEPAAGGRRRLVLRRSQLGERVVIALVGAGALRALTGFLTIFLAFLLRDRGGLGQVSGGNAALGVVIGAAAVGGVVGTALGGRIRSRAPLALVSLAVAVAAVASVAGAAFYGLAAMLLLAGAAGAGQGVSKLALDSLVQREVDERVRSSAFSLSESVLQFAWVIGGIVGIALPLWPWLGFGAAAVGCTLTLGYCLRGSRRLHVARLRPRPAG